MADDHEDRFRRHEEMLQGLARIWDAQHTLNQDQRAINERLTLAIERIDLTLARLETLMTEVFRERTNGRDA
jgi:hypothetical protein